MLFHYNLPRTFDIIQKVLFQGLNAHLLIETGQNISILIDLILKKVNPLDSLKLVFDEHFPE